MNSLNKPDKKDLTMLVGKASRLSSRFAAVRNTTGPSEPGALPPSRNFLFLFSRLGQWESTSTRINPILSDPRGRGTSKLEHNS